MLAQQSTKQHLSEAMNEPELACGDFTDLLHDLASAISHFKQDDIESLSQDDSYRDMMRKLESLWAHLLEIDHIKQMDSGLHVSANDSLYLTLAQKLNELIDLLQ